MRGTGVWRGAREMQARLRGDLHHRGAHGGTRRDVYFPTRDRPADVRTASQQLVMKVRRVGFILLTDTTAQILENWVITGGTGRLAGLQGAGTMAEVFDFGSAPPTLGGSVNGLVR